MADNTFFPNKKNIEVVASSALRLCLERAIPIWEAGSGMCLLLSHLVTEKLGCLKYML